jgi:hypothetical protein
MIRKLKSSTRRKHPKKRPPYLSSAQRPSPAERLATLLKEAEERGIKAFTEMDFERLLAEESFWPEDESIEDFLAWRRQSRREKR